MFKKVILLLLTSVLFFVVTGCAGDSFNKDPNGTGIDDPVTDDGTGNGELPVFTVMLTENTGEYEIVGENPVRVVQGGTAEFTLKMNGDCCVDRVVRQGSEADAEIINGYDGTTTVRLSDVRWSVTLTVECSVAQAYIAYYPNGGVYYGKMDPETPYTVGHTLRHRLRPNTEIGADFIRRKGYILTGWNTEPDGSGERIGLGSRVTAVRGGTLKLYAQWAEVTPLSEFRYRKYIDSVTILEYTGSSENVVVPGGIDGLPVYKIASGAFTGAVRSVVLPESVTTVETGAFTDCDIEELYFFDNIGNISDESFIRCPYFSTVHINAITAPRYGASNLYSEVSLADKYDILILNADKKKVLVFGGSGAFISVDTKQIESELKAAGEDYVCINMAVNGWFNGAAQFDMMMPYLRDGDIFVHAPESASQFGLMYELSMTPSYEDFDYNRLRLYACLESNYDLIGLIDFRDVEGLLDGFSEFNAKRSTMEETTYEDWATKINLFGTVYENDMGWIDDRGNFALPRKPRGALIDAGEADIVPEYVLDEEASGRLNAVYDGMAAKGVKVCFLTAPINTDTLLLRMNDPGNMPSSSDHLYAERPYDIPLLYDDLGEWVSDFDEAVRTRLHCTVIAPLADTLYVTEDFFDSDYHLSDENVPGYTGIIADRLVEITGGDT